MDKPKRTIDAFSIEAIALYFLMVDRLDMAPAKSDLFFLLWQAALQSASARMQVELEYRPKNRVRQPWDQHFLSP
jgi:hypothetical protein